MTTSTTLKNNKLLVFLSAIFWIFIWQIASIIIGEDLLLVSPYTVLKTLMLLMRDSTFWSSVLSSFVRIVGGFVLALAAGISLACISARVRIIEILLSPFMLTVRTVPVASFIVLALMWLRSAKNLAVLISFMMVLPIIYTGVLQGIKNTDIKLRELAKVYNMSRIKRVLYIFAPQIMPHFVSACTVSLGLCWKSGVAAEVIGITSNSIGGAIYTAKLLFATDEVFAWTIVIVLISVAFEKLVLMGIDKLQARWFV